MESSQPDAASKAGEVGPGTEVMERGNNGASSSSEEQIAELEYGHAGLQEMLGEALAERTYLQEKHRLDRQAIQLLQRKTQQVTAESEAGFQLLKNQKAQEEQDLQRQLATREFQLSESRLEAQQWKRKAALLQLRLASVQEDVDHYRKQHELLGSEHQVQAQQAQARQEQLVALQQSKAQLESQLAAQQAAMQDQLSTLRDSISTRDAQLATASKQIEQLQAAVAAAECANRDRLLDAQQRIASVEERVRLADQMTAAAQERAALAEQRLAHRSEAIEARLKAAEGTSSIGQDLSQERLRAAVEKANLLEQHLREQFAHAQADLKRETTRGLAMQAELRQKDQRIRALEEMCKEPSCTPGRKAAEAMDLVGALVNDLTGVAPTDAAQAAVQQAKPKRARKATAAAVQAPVPEPEPAPEQPAQPARHQRAAASRAATKIRELGLDEAGEGSKRAGSGPSVSHQPQGGSDEVPKGKAARKQAGVGRQRASKAKQAHQDEAGAAAEPSNSAPHAGIASLAEGEPSTSERQAKSAPAQRGGAAEPSKLADDASSPRQPAAFMAQHAEHAGGAGIAPDEPKQRKALPKSRLGPQGTKRPAETAEDAGQAKRRRKPSARALAAQAIFDSEAEISEDEGGVSDFDDELRRNAVADATAADKREAEQKAKAAAQKRKDTTRPGGIAKIDLSTVWGQAPTPGGGHAPQTAAAEAEAEPAPEEEPTAAEGQRGKENASQSEEAAAVEEKPVAGNKRPQDMLAAINPRVLEAAAARSNAAPNVTAKAAIRKSYSAKPEPSGEGPAKRKLLKPTGNGYMGYVDTLPASMLFGDSFKVPKLLKR